MKLFFTSLVILLSMSACSHQNAFSKFNIDDEQELGAGSLQSSQITSGKIVKGVFSAIYLNDVYPETYNTNECFYIYMYLKEKNEDALYFELNGKKPIELQQLPHANEFSHLAFTQSEWNSYYLVRFEKEKAKSLQLILKTGASSSQTLSYSKDKE